MKQIQAHFQNSSRRTRRNFAGLIISAAGLTLLCGCQVLTYTGPSGEHFMRSSLGANVAVSELAIEAGTNGLRRVELKGYQNDSGQALGIVTEAAVRAALLPK
jgi:hypothetical protein